MTNPRKILIFNQFERPT